LDFLTFYATFLEFTTDTSEAGYYGEWGGPVSQFMSTKIEDVAPEDNLVDVSARMAQSPHRRYPVVENGRLVGLLSLRDVLRVLNSGSWFRLDSSKPSHL
jgi:CBS domain-containing protein